MDEFDFQPGVYVVDNQGGLNVRTKPDTTNPSNLIGRRFLQGKRFPVYKVVTAGKGEKWGIISAPDVHTEQTLYVCIWNLQTLFASPVGGAVGSDQRLDDLEKRIKTLEEWQRAVITTRA